MVKIWALLGLVLVGVCLSEASKHRKRQSSIQRCCYPSKYAWNIVRKSRYSSFSGNNTDPFSILSTIISTTSVSESIEIVDNLTRYSANDGNEYGSLSYVADGNSTYVSYSSYSKCFYVYSSPYYSYGSTQNCLYGYTYQNEEEKDGANYSVFVSNYSSSYSNETKKIYATLNEAGECSPRIWYEESYYGYSSPSYSKYTTTTLYSDLEMGPEQQSWLEPPPESRRCKNKRK